MRLAIIFSILAFRIAAQSPDFRCIEVLPNNDVRLSWLPPADPSGTFNQYIIFYSPVPNGNFTPVGSQGPLGNTTFTHTGSAANLQSVYYYVQAVFGSGSSTTAANSTTLHSIFLNIINTSGAPAVKLVFNTVSTPNLPSYTAAATVSKEYPMGTWNALAVTNQLSLYDTISVCTTSLNYRVTMQNSSGCISGSNIQGGIFSDTKSPYQPYVDSISVLPSGQVILAWHIPKDEDLIKYVIYQAVKDPVSGNITYPPIDTITGRNNTNYSYVGGGIGSLPISLFVAGLDSCGNIGTYDSLPRTIQVGAYYDSCRFESQLYWNPYRNMPKGLLDYRVYYSVNGGAFSAIGSTTATAFLHKGVAPGQSVCYLVRAFNSDRSISSSSNRLCFTSNQARAPGYLYMRTATVLKKNSVNIRVLLDTAVSCTGVAIERSEDGIGFRRIAMLPATKNPDYSYDDDSAQSSRLSYYYRAYVVDNCGNRRTQSNTSRTMLLTVKEDKELFFTKRLNWNLYSGFGGGIDHYNIYRVVNGQWPQDPLTSVGQFVTSYVDEMEDEAAKGSKVEYVIEAVEGGINPYGYMETSRSNAAAVYVEGQVFVPTAFAPAGKNKIWLPVTHFVDKNEYNVTVYNRWGNKVFETSDDSQGWNGDGAEGGIYVYLISYKNARGEYIEQKGTFLLYR